MKLELFMTLINSVSSLYRSNQAKHFFRNKIQFLSVTRMSVTRLPEFGLLIIDFEMMTHSDDDQEE